jgi:DNA-binding beta-propeller fold protein YncE
MGKMTPCLKTSALRLFSATALYFASLPAAHSAADYATPYVTSTFAGISSIGSSDGAGTQARFYSPQGIAVDSTGNSYVVDEGNHTIRKITPAGVVTTLAGSPGIPGAADGTGAAARFDSP